MMKGWINLHRSSMDHWLYRTKKPKTYREAWEDILMLVNYEDNKDFIRGQLYECKRGQSLLSLDSWAKQFNWTKQQVRTFFSLLQKDEMLTLEGLQYTTRLTVCNYDKYQRRPTYEQHTDEHTDNIIVTPQQHPTNIQITSTKEEKKDNKTKNKVVSEKGFSDEVNELYNSVVLFFDENLRPKTPEQKKTWLDTLDKVMKIDNYSPDQINTIVKQIRLDTFWRTNFLSITKLRNTDKQGVKYIDVFNAKVNGNGSNKQFNQTSKKRINDIWDRENTLHAL